MMRSIAVSIVLSLTGIGLAAGQDDSHTNELQSLQETYASAKFAMPREFDGVRLSDDDQDAVSIISLNKQWQSLGEFVALKAQLERPVVPNDYARIVTELDRDLEVNAIALDLRTVAIAIARGQVGHVMVITAAPDRSATVWHISDFEGSALSAGEELKCWTANGYGNRTCYSRSIGKLSDDTRGEHRFFIDGAYAQVAGGVTVSQLSVWKWDGKAARPIYATSYDSSAETDDRAIAARNFIRIRERGQWTSLFACGACEGRQLLRELRVTDEGVVDLGTKSLSPEVDFIDGLLTQLAAGKNVTALAGDSVVAAMRSMNSVRGKGENSLQLLDSPKIERLGVAVGVCLHVEGSLPIRFLLEQSAGGFRAVGALPTEQCVVERS